MQCLLHFAWYFEQSVGFLSSRKNIAFLIKLTVNFNTFSDLPDKVLSTGSLTRLKGSIGKTEQPARKRNLATVCAALVLVVTIVPFVCMLERRTELHYSLVDALI